MTEIIIKRINHSLVPVDEHGMDILDELEMNKEFLAKITQPRNIGNHKRFFAFIKIAFSMQDYYTTQEQFRKWLLMKAGYAMPITDMKTGKTAWAIESMNSASMDEIKFKEAFSNLINVFLAEFGNGMTEDELMRVIEFG